MSGSSLRGWPASSRGSSSSFALVRSCGRISPVRCASFAGDLNELAIALVDGPTLLDVCTLSRCAVEDHLSIRDAADLHIGPTFAQSGPLGGADADLIYDGTLLDLKSTSTARVLGGSSCGNCRAISLRTPSTPTAFDRWASACCAEAGRSSGRLKS